MLKYPCLVLDHDDTAVNSTATVHYPAFVEFMKIHRPDLRMTLEEYFRYNFDPGVIPFFRDICGLTEAEMKEEEIFWQGFVQHRVPEAYPGIRGIALRYFNPIGAHPSALIGELPRGVPNNLVPFITQTAIGKRECLSVFGNDYPTPDGTCLRDFIDIVDLAKAHVCAVTRMCENKMKKEYEIFNVGTGRPLSVLELINAFEKVNNLKLNWKYAPRRPGDVVAIWADPTLAEQELGWKAERSIEETLAAAWAWEKRLAGK